MRTRVLVAMSIAWCTARAEADPATHVVVAGRDPKLVAALADAFAPTGMTVSAVDAPPPSSVGELASASRSVADRESARSVVWLIAGDAGTSLVAYDRAADRVLVRTLPFTPPLSAARAAETARMARTMLRALQIPDEPEPQAPPPVQPLVVVAMPPEALPGQSQVAVLLGLGGRYGRLGEAGALEATVGAIWRPASLGVILLGAVSPRSTIDTPSIMGHSADHSLAIAARAPVGTGGNVDLALLGGVAVHAVSLDVTYAGEPVSSLRFDPAIRLGTITSYALSSQLHLGVVLWVDTLLRRQRYDAPDDVVVVPRVQASANLTVSWWLR